jgi:hypothetical protein
MLSTQTAEQNKYDKYRCVAASEQNGRIIRLSVAAAAAVTAAFLGSFLGTAGTLIGTGLAAMISGAAAELYGHVAAKAKKIVPGVPVHVPVRISGKLVGQLAMGALGVAIIGYVAVFGIEKAAGKPLQAITTGQSVSGNSFTGTTPGTPEPVTTPSQVIAPATKTGTPASESASPSESPSESAVPSGSGGVGGSLAPSVTITDGGGNSQGSMPPVPSPAAGSPEPTSSP